MSSLYGTFADRLGQVIFVRSLRVGSKITWHFVCKMSSLYGTFADRLGQVIFVRSLMPLNMGYIPEKDQKKPSVDI